MEHRSHDTVHHCKRRRYLYSISNKWKRLYEQLQQNSNGIYTSNMQHYRRQLLFRKYNPVVRCNKFRLFMEHRSNHSMCHCECRRNLYDNSIRCKRLHEQLQQNGNGISVAKLCNYR